MTATDFADALCAALIRHGAFRADTAAHHLTHECAASFFPAAEAAVLAAHAARAPHPPLVPLEPGAPGGTGRVPASGSGG